MRKSAALAVLKSELGSVGWDTTSAFTIEDEPRHEASDLAWWHANTPENESSETLRNLAYLRAYLKISGRSRLTAKGLQLDRGRLWMDRSVISRLERDGYLKFVANAGGEFEPVFELTPRGAEWIEK